MRPKWFSPCQVGRLDCLPLSIAPHLLSSLAPLLAREAQCDATTRELCETSSGDLLPGAGEELLAPPPDDGDEACDEPREEERALCSVYGVLRLMPGPGLNMISDRTYFVELRHYLGRGRGRGSAKMDAR